MRHLWQQQYDNAGDRRGGKSGIDAGNEGQRADNNSENGEQRDFIIVRNKHRDRAAIDRAAQRPDQIIERGFQRPPDTHLRYDQGGDDRP
jgi:hypothetical protein